MHKDPHIAHMFSAEEEDCLSLDQMQAYQRGSLAGDERHAVERHLLNCELCTLTYESMAEHGAEAIATGARAVADMAWDRVAQQHQRKRRGAIFWIASAAAMALLITIGYFSLQGPSIDEMETTYSQGIGNTPPLKSPLSSDSQALAMNREHSAADEAAEPSAKMELGAPDRLGPAEYEATATEKRNTAMADERSTDPGDYKKYSESRDNALAKDASNPLQPAAKPTPAAKNDTRTAVGASSLPKDGIGGAPAGGKGSVANAGMPAPSPSMVSGADKSIDLSEGPRKEVLAENSQPVRRDLEMEDGESYDDYAGGKVMTSDVVTVESKAADRARTSPAKSKVSKRDEGAAMGRAVPQEAQEPANPYAQGIYDYNQGNYADAAQNLRKATERTPANLDAHIHAADAFIRISQPKAALYHIERVLAVPGNTYYEDAQWFKALALLQMHEGRKAKAQLEAIIASNGKFKAQAQTALDNLD